jgi:hypothetical protein
MSVQLRGMQGSIAISLPLTKIGRAPAPENQLVIFDERVSGYHAEIKQQGHNYILVDKGSKNGTFVNGQRLVPHVDQLLNDGDTVRFGDTIFSYENKSFQHLLTTKVTPPPSTPLPNSSPKQPQQQVTPPQPPKDPVVKTAWIALISAVLVALIGGVFGIITKIPLYDSTPPVPTPTSNPSVSSIPSVPQLHVSYSGTLTVSNKSDNVLFTISSLTEDDNGNFNASGSEETCSTSYQGIIHADNSISFDLTETKSAPNCSGGVARLIGRLYPDQHLEGTWQGLGSNASSRGDWSMQ